MRAPTMASPSFFIARTFTDSLASLTGDDQKAAKLTAFDLQLNPASPGLKFHRCDKARDRNFWSARVNDGTRIIVHKTDGHFILCFVGPHNKAYAWAEHRKLTQEDSSAISFVEVRETTQEIFIPVYIEQPQVAAPVKPLSTEQPIFAKVSEATLIGLGIPREDIPTVVTLTEDSLFTFCADLPQHTAKALVDLATTTSIEHHLSNQKRALIAARYATFLSLAAIKRRSLFLRQYDAAPKPEGRSAQIAADRFHVTYGSTKRAIKVLKLGHRELTQAVSNETVSLDAAALVAELPHEQQKALIDSNQVRQMARSLREAKKQSKAIVNFPSRLSERQRAELI